MPNRKSMSPQQNDPENGLYKQDMELVQRMVSSDRKTMDLAWEEFYRKYPLEVIKRWIRNTFPGTFNETEVDEIYGLVIDRILKDDQKALRNYEARCSLKGFLIGGPIYWACADKYQKKKVFPTVSLSEKEESTEDDSAGVQKKESDHVREHYISELPISSELSRKKKIPEAVMELDQERRWVFLLRYYDDFGFPPSELRALAKERGVTIGEISQRIERIFEKEDILATQREKVNKKKDQVLRKWRKVLEGDDSLRESIDSYVSMIQTPYEAIGDILMVKNMNTLRGRLKEAKELLLKYYESHGHYFS